MNKLLLTYMRQTEIGDEYLWKKSAEQQMCFIRDTVCHHLLNTEAFIISTHRSKSIELPVYAFLMRNGIKVIARCNFYDWVASIELPETLPQNYLPKDLFCGGYGKDNDVHFFEGFKDTQEYEAYCPDKQQLKFSVSLHNHYDFYTFMFLLKNAFPEITYEQFTLTADDITQTLFEIYYDNDVPEHMSEWECLYSTYFAINKDLNDVILNRDIKESRAFAEYILKSPSAQKAFLFSKKSYETVF